MGAARSSGVPPSLSLFVLTRHWRRLVQWNTHKCPAEGLVTPAFSALAVFSLFGGFLPVWLHPSFCRYHVPVMTLWLECAGRCPGRLRLVKHVFISPSCLYFGGCCSLWRGLRAVYLFEGTICRPAGCMALAGKWPGVLASLFLCVLVPGCPTTCSCLPGGVWE